MRNSEQAATQAALDALQEVLARWNYSVGNWMLQGSFVHNIHLGASKCTTAAAQGFTPAAVAASEGRRAFPASEVCAKWNLNQRDPEGYRGSDLGSPASPPMRGDGGRQVRGGGRVPPDRAQDEPPRALPALRGRRAEALQGSPRGRCAKVL